MHDSQRNNNSAYFFIDSIKISVSTSTASLLTNGADVSIRRSRFDSSGVGAPITIDGTGRVLVLNSVVINSSDWLGGQHIISIRRNVPDGGYGLLRMNNTYVQSGSTGSSPGLMSPFRRSTSTGDGAHDVERRYGRYTLLRVGRWGQLSEHERLLHYGWLTVGLRR
jgi:hypothetical protein